MTPERWRRVEAVFHEVVELPPTDRAARVASACDGDDELRREIESLLASTTDAARSMREAIATVAASLPRSQPLRIGERLGGRYLIEELLGTGGMGAVYRAVDEKLGEAVALKVVRSSVDEQLLRDEVRLAQRVTHPSVCRTFDLEEVDGHHLVKMELVRGETLARRLQREGKLPVAECVRVARSVAAGLGAAHDCQIVHGDLKPANIMLDRTRVVLMDFGIARVAAAPVAGMRGTIGYLAPELVRDRQADQRADLYALGCVLYEMLAGEPVFPAGSATQVGARHIAMPVPDVRRRRTDTPRWLANALGGLLAKHPEDRNRGLQQLLAGPRSRSRIVVPIVVAAVAMVGVAWWLTRPAPWVAHVRDYEGFDENINRMSFSPDGKWLVFGSNRAGIGAARLYLMSVRTGETTMLLDQFGTDPNWSRDGSSILFDTDILSYRLPIAGNPPRSVGRPEQVGLGEQPASCGDSVLVLDRHITGGQLFLRLPGGETRPIFASRGRDFILFFRCDRAGQQIAIVAGTSGPGGHNDVYLADRRGNVRALTTDHQTGDYAVFTEDGRSLVVSRLVDDRLQLFEMSLDGKHLRRLLDDGGMDEPMEVSRDGRAVAFLRGEQSSPPVVFADHETTYLTRQRGAFAFPREVGPGVVVAALHGRSGSEIAIVRQDASSTTVVAQGTQPFPSRDGTTIYFGGSDDPQALEAVAVTGGPAHEVARLPGRIDFGDAGPDGLHVSVKLDDGQFAGFRIHDGIAEREADGLVTVAPSGAWRAVTVYDETLFNAGAELYILGPGDTVDHPAHRVHVASPYNPWLDDHRIGYVMDKRAEVLDVVTGTTKVLPVAVSRPVFRSVMRDGEHVLGCAMDAHYTRHVITNFGDR